MTRARDYESGSGSARFDVRQLPWNEPGNGHRTSDSPATSDTPHGRYSRATDSVSTHEMRKEADTAPTNSAELDAYDAHLAERAKARSPEAWTEIYETHYATIYRYVKARVFEDATAEDLTSAVFLSALKGIDSYQYRGRPLLAWLYRIARNVVASHQRRLLEHPLERLKRGLDLSRKVGRRFIQRTHEQYADAANPGLTSAGTGEGDPAGLVDRIDLRDAMAKLPASQREVVILRFFAGLSAQEVAEVTGKGPAAVYSLQARAIVTLRERLE